MNNYLTSENRLNISALGNIIPEGYTHYEKIISPGSQLNLPCASFKWYNLYPDNNNISIEEVSKAKDFITSQSDTGLLQFENELGFVILHRAGDCLLLLVTTWRNINEMWESIYFKKAETDDVYKQMDFKKSHKGTYCIWELGIVWHERNAWIRFMNSQKDNNSKTGYMNDLFSGKT